MFRLLAPDREIRKKQLVEWQMSYPTGWIHRPQAIAAYLDERRIAGDQPMIGDAKPQLSGHWSRQVMAGVRAVLIYQAEEQLYGEFRGADYQQRGTCVSRGTYRAIQDGHYWDILHYATMAKPVQWAYEPVYGGSRVEIGGGRIGGDGSVGAWAAKWVHSHGMCPRGVYGRYDLSKSNEDLAVMWGSYGVPEEIEEASRAHKVTSHYVPTVEDLADVTAAGYCSAICSSHRFSDARDSNGMCSYAGTTAHCEEICGVFIRPSWDGRPESIMDHTGFVDQQSWGNVPSGPDILRYQGGEAKLRQGAYGIASQLMRSRMKTGETWAFGHMEGVRPQSLSELVR